MAQPFSREDQLGHSLLTHEQLVNKTHEQGIHWLFALSSMYQEFLIQFYNFS